MCAHDHELEQLRAGVNCAVVLETLTPAWTLDQKESTKRCLKYRRDGEILIVNHDGRGWWDPQSDAKGDVFSLIQHLDRGLNFGQVRRVLRRLVGIEPSYAPAGGPRRNDGHRPSPDARWQARRRLRRGSPTWRYLADTRALPPAILFATAAVDAVREGPCGSAWFAHRGHDGVLTGIEMRGPKFRSFSPDGRKTLFRLPGSAGTVTRVAVCEAPIDAMSLAALERMRANTVYVATGGGMGPDTIAALGRLMRDLTGRACALVSVAPDGDAAGERYAAKLHQMTGEAGVRSERLHPPPGHKDWNAYLQARGRGDEP